MRLRYGQLSLDPYSGFLAGLTPEQLQAYNFLTDPLFQYTSFGLPSGPANPYPGLFPSSPPNPLAQLGPEQGAPSAFGAQLFANTPESGNVEWGERLDDPLMAQLQSSLAVQSTGLSPTIGQMPSSPPWVTAAPPGALAFQAGFGDIGNAPNLRQVYRNVP